MTIVAVGRRSPVDVVRVGEMTKANTIDAFDPLTLLAVAVGGGAVLGRLVGIGFGWGAAIGFVGLTVAARYVGGGK